MTSDSGAAYGDSGKPGQRAFSQQDDAKLLRNLVAGGVPVLEGYRRMGVGNWSDLPGSLEEVNAIAGVLPGAEKVTGNAVSELNIKERSKRGELSRYRVLHFATHGLASADIPELSALVLSHPGREVGGEDGYLTAKEVRDLNLRADFVALSACDTALGRLYGGEGMVGLTHAFLAAGANGVAVSLWPVQDDSTAKFMAALYGAVGRQTLSYDAALADTKRRFAAGEFGEPYRAPRHWAPFVYYGR